MTMRRSAFTLVELMVVIAIIAILAVTMYAATGPARERARQSYCMGNLHQLGIALSMYRADYAGGDTGNWPNYGLPPSHYRLAPYVKSPAVFHCPDVPSEQKAYIESHARSPYWTNYDYGIWYPGTVEEAALGRWSAAAQARGDDYPIFDCLDHNFLFSDRPHRTRFILALRLGGQVTASYAEDGGLTWNW